MAHEWHCPYCKRKSYSSYEFPYDGYIFCASCNSFIKNPHYTGKLFNNNFKSMNHYYEKINKLRGLL